MSMISVTDLDTFTGFMKEVFGAHVSVRNKSENLIITLNSGLITGTKDGMFYTLAGDPQLVKNVTGLWTAALSATQTEPVQALAQHGDKNEIPESLQ